MMRRWDNLVDLYIKELSIRGKSIDYIKNVQRELERWGAWTKRKKPKPKLETLDSDLIISYIRTRTPFKAKTTIYGTISKLRGMGDFLVREEVWSSNPLRWIQGPKLSPYNRMPKRIDSKDMTAMWEFASSYKWDYQRYMWITILALLYGTGVRRGELARLKVSDWERESGIIVLDGRKTGCERKVPVPDLVHQCIETYLPHRHNHIHKRQRFGSQSLFLSPTGNALSDIAISRGVHRIAKNAGFKLHSLHQFRHTCASDLLSSGVGIAEVQQILGQQCLDTTMRYLHIADPERHEAIALHPINDWLTQEA